MQLIMSILVIIAIIAIAQTAAAGSFGTPKTMIGIYYDNQCTLLIKHVYLPSSATGVCTNSFDALPYSYGVQWSPTYKVKIFRQTECRIAGFYGDMSSYCTLLPSQSGYTKILDSNVLDMPNDVLFNQLEVGFKKLSNGYNSQAVQQSVVPSCPQSPLEFTQTFESLPFDSCLYYYDDLLKVSYMYKIHSCNYEDVQIKNSARYTYTKFAVLDTTCLFPILHIDTMLLQFLGLCHQHNEGGVILGNYQRSTQQSCRGTGNLEDYPVRLVTTDITSAITFSEGVITVATYKDETKSFFEKAYGLALLIAEVNDGKIEYKADCDVTSIAKASRRSRFLLATNTTTGSVVVTFTATATIAYAPGALVIAKSMVLGQAVFHGALITAKEVKEFKQLDIDVPAATTMTAQKPSESSTSASTSGATNLAVSLYAIIALSLGVTLR